MTGLEIERMHVLHIPEILEIERTLFPTPWTMGMFEQEVAAAPSEGGPGSYAMVATLDGQVAGYTVAWFVEDGVHLMNIAVRKEFQRQGVGARLMEHLIGTAQKARKAMVMLEVRASNAAAKAFYRRFAFEQFGVRRGYYVDNREDAVLMALLLPPVPRRKREARKRKSN